MAGDLTHQRPRAGVSLNEYPRAQPCSRSIRGYTQAHCALAAQPIPLLPSFLLSSMKMRAVTFAAAIAGVALLSCSYVHAEEEARLESLKPRLETQSIPLSVPVPK